MGTKFKHGGAPTRRRVLQAGLGLVAVSACAGCALFRKLSEPDLRLSAGTTTIRLPRADYPALASPGGLVRVVVGEEQRVLIVRGANGVLVALDMTCTHFGSDLGYDAEAGVLACPSHGSRFDLGGRVVEGPADEPLERWEVRETEIAFEVMLG